MRSAGSEAGHIGNVVSRYALAYPEVRFTLRADGRLALQAPGTGDLRDAAAAVYGAQVAASLLDLRALEEAERTELAVQGLASPHHVTRATRNDISLFINRRWVRSRTLTFAVEEGYQGQLPSGRHPLAVVYVRLPAEEVDVNVHPAKAEVRLRREREVFGAVRDAVRATLSPSAEGPVSKIAAPRVWGAAPDGWARPEAADLTLTSPAYQPELVAGTREGNGAASGVPMLRPVGQVGNLYVVAESAEGLYLIDQHAAHERVLYERFLADLEAARLDTQPLLQPVTVELTPRQQALLGEYAGEMRAQGFDIEPFGEGAWALRAVPAPVAADPGKGLSAVLDLLDREDADSERRHRVAASLACHAAVRAGKTLSDAEMRELVEQLEATVSPRTCPHGRPTMLHLSADHLAREFRRR
jgi:DNA mismatch repair protein MutL